MPTVARGLSAAVQTAPAALLVRGGAMVSPAMVNFCANAAPMASMLIFFAVSDEKVNFVLQDQPVALSHAIMFFNFHLQPYPTIDQVVKDKNVGSLPLLPYSSMMANCFLWMVYGLLKQESKIWATNGIGAVFGLFYFLRFIKYAPPKSPTFPGSIGNHIAACVAVLAASAGVTALLPVNEAASIIGNLAVLFCIAMFASPLASLKTVLRTKSAKSIPLPFTLATVVNCILWSVAGIFQMKDIKVYLPNILGLTFGLAQVSLKLMYGDSRPRLEREEPLV
jgi:solute carrier family 50 protein (sugar transporter)